MSPRRFQSTTGAQVAVYLPDRPCPVYVPADGQYATDDPVEITALDGSPEVMEIQVKVEKPRTKGTKDAALQVRNQNPRDPR